MQVTESNSGIVESHIGAIQATARTRNTFIFVRPTELDSTRLIRAGYATKSVDIHHKSSNWGPMAGFVPCDPAFSKTCAGQPNPHESERSHGAARPVQLSLPTSLVDGHPKIERQKNGYALASDPRAPGVYRVVRSSTSEALRVRSPGLPEHRFYLPMPSALGVKSTLFCLLREGPEWKVYWAAWTSGVGRLYPVRVWAYQLAAGLRPVTGDYDLWMVAPHISQLADHAVAQLNENRHGRSVASAETMTLLQDLNAACHRQHNPVFNHGAEAQNYAFAQPLDKTLAMFTPGGTSRIVHLAELPGVLADLHMTGYLVVWNKRYGEVDPRLGGLVDPRSQQTLSALRVQLTLLMNALDRMRDHVDPAQLAKDLLAAREVGRPIMPQAMQNELKVAAARSQLARGLGIEQSLIFRFHRDLLASMRDHAGVLCNLSRVELPPSYFLYGTEAARFHLALQHTLVTTTTRSGATADVDLLRWMVEHRQQIAGLLGYWAGRHFPAVPTSPLAPEVLTTA